MSARYTIVRIVPNSLAEEFVNVGLIAWDDGELCGRFLTSWTRAERFAGGPIEPSVRPLVEAVRSGRVSPSEIEQIVAKWAGFVQLAPVRVAALGARQFVERFAAKFLFESTAFEATEQSSKMRLIQWAEAEVRAALGASVGTARALTTERFKRLPGQVDGHVFDLVVRARQPVLAVATLAHEPKGRGLLELAEGLALRILDVRQCTERAPPKFGVLFSEALRAHPKSVKAKQYIERASASVLEPDGFRSWVTSALAA